MTRKILALDIGDKRIGVAIADKDTLFPHPLTTLDADSEIANKLRALIAEHNVEDIVIGLPRNQSGERTKQTERVEKIVKLLNLSKDIAIHWQDESLTSVKAEAELKRRKKPYQKEDVDALAATFILEDYAKNPSTNTPSDITKKKKHSPKKLGLLIVSGFVFIVLIAVASLYGWYKSQLRPLTADDVYHVITIDSGSSTSEISQQLEDKKIIRNSRAFQIFASRHKTLLQAGSYRLSSKLSVPEIADILASGKVTSVDILIPPGLRLDQVKARLVKAGFSDKEVEEALKSVRSHPLLKDLPPGSTLEGYLFPDTYK